MYLHNHDFIILKFFLLCLSKFVFIEWPRLGLHLVYNLLTKLLLGKKYSCQVLHETPLKSGFQWEISYSAAPY